MRPALPYPLFVSIPDTCRMLGCGETTLRRYVEAGDLHLVHIASRSLLATAEVFQFSNNLARKAGVGVDPTKALLIDGAPDLAGSVS